MAVLVLWWRQDDSPIDEQIWAGMIAAARAGSPRHTETQFSASGESYRAFALRTYASEPVPLRQLADGSLVLAALRHEACDQELLIPPRTEAAATIRLEPVARRLTLSRDALGQRTLVWCQIKGGVLVASREELLLPHPGVSRQANLAFLAARAAFVQGRDGDTALQAVQTLEPGELLQISPDGERRERHLPEPDPWVAGKTERQLVARFFELLQAALLRAHADAQRPTLTLSSGFDSSALAALWNHAGRPGGTLNAVNYGFSREGEIDERPYARDLARRLDLQLSQINAADFPPAVLQSTCPQPLNHPEFDCYHALNQRIAELAQAAGSDVVLTGGYADHMGYGGHRWCIDALKRGRFDIILRGYGRLLLRRGVVDAWRDPGWRLLLKSLGPAHMQQPWSAPEWLLPKWRHELAELAQRRSAQFAEWPDPQRAEFHLRSAHAAQDGLFNSIMEVHGLDYRHPFRDYDLIRFLLALPAHMLARPLQNKWIAKQALTGILPQRWIKPAKRGMLGTTLLRECEQAWPAIGAGLRGGESEWMQIFDADSVQSSLTKSRVDSWFDPALRAHLLQQWISANRGKLGL